MYHPNPDIQAMQVDENTLVLFDPATSDSHILEETALEIYRLCDGTLTADEMVQTLAQRYQEDPENIRGDVEEFLSQLLEKKVILS